MEFHELVLLSLCRAMQTTPPLEEDAPFSPSAAVMSVTAVGGRPPHGALE